MKRYKRTAISQYLFVGLLLLGIVALCFLSADVMRRIPFQDHFVIPWAASRMWLLEGVTPYDEAVLTLAEETLSQSAYLGSLPDSAELIDPAINLVFYLPFSLIPYEISRAVWMTLLVLVTGMISHYGLRLSGWQVSRVEKLIIILLTVLWLPGISNIITGKLTPIIILLILLSIYLTLRGDDTRAGFMLALTFGSFLTSVLVLLFIIVWSISRRRWSVVTAYFSGVIFLFAITLLFIPSWPLNWLRVILNTYTDWSWVHTPLMDFAVVLPGIADYLSIFLHVIFGIYLLYLLISILGKSGREFTWKVLLSLVVMFLFNVQASISQVLIVLPATFLMFRSWSERWRSVGRLIDWCLIILIVVGSWFFVKPEISFVKEMSLPVLVVGLPILVIIGMIWIRWWAFRITRLPFEPR